MAVCNEIIKEMIQQLTKAYLSRLSNLNVNSNVYIERLTATADENVEYAEMIAALIIDQIATVPEDSKWPLLCLIDAITMTSNRDLYIGLFSSSLVEMFSNAFQEASHEMRVRMFHLRRSWDGVFDDNLLYELDIKVHIMDGKWPVLGNLDDTNSEGNEANFLEMLKMRKVRLERDLESTELLIQQMEIKSLNAMQEETPVMNGNVDFNSLDIAISPTSDKSYIENGEVAPENNTETGVTQDAEIQTIPEELPEDFIKQMQDLNCYIEAGEEHRGQESFRHYIEKQSIKEEDDATTKICNSLLD